MRPAPRAARPSPRNPESDRCSVDGSSTAPDSSCAPGSRALSSTRDRQRLAALRLLQLRQPKRRRHARRPPPTIRMSRSSVSRSVTTDRSYTTAASMRYDRRMRDVSRCQSRRDVAADALDWAHPIVREWFLGTLRLADRAAGRRAGRTSSPAASTLISAPTGSGKTLAAFLACIDRLVRQAARRHAGGPHGGPVRLAAQGARQRHPEEPRRPARGDRRAGARARHPTAGDPHGRAHRRHADAGAPGDAASGRRTSWSRRRSRSTSC